jgi:hypothetical protein
MSCNVRLHPRYRRAPNTSSSRRVPHFRARLRVHFEETSFLYRRRAPKQHMHDMNGKRLAKNSASFFLLVKPLFFTDIAHQSDIGTIWKAEGTPETLQVFFAGDRSADVITIHYQVEVFGSSHSHMSVDVSFVSLEPPVQIRRKSNASV